MAPKNLLLLPLCLAAYFARAASAETVVEAESITGAVVQSDARASGTKVAIASPTLVFDGVAVAQAGVYELRLETFDTQMRTVCLSVNGGKPVERQVSPGYDNTAGTGVWEVPLKDGANTIEVRGKDSSALAIDRLLLVRRPSVTDSPGREVVAFDLGWLFRWGKARDGEENWQRVDLPHDAQFAQPWTPSGGGARGFKPMGEMWYRKSFRVADWPFAIGERRVFLELGGLLCIGDVYLNGRKVGSTDYGYLPVVCDLTEALNLDGDNLLEVWCSTSRREGSRWYTGAGLYRDAKIVVKPRVSIAKGGVYVTSKVAGAAAQVAVSVELDGFCKQGNKVKLDVEVAIKDAAGNIVAEATARAPWSKNEHQEVALPTMTIANVALWDVEAPNLYTADVRLKYDGVEIDRESVRFGVRTIELDSAYGFKLNGRKLFLKSMSNHHDMGCVGAAAYRRAIERQFKLMKAFGYNAIRCSHNPYSEDFYDLADEMGLLVLDELIDKWSDKDYFFARRPFTAIWPQLVTAWMKRDRNHPSIFAWSFGNELQMRDDLCGYADVNDWGVTMYKVIKAFSTRWDETRATTVAMYPSRAGAISKKDPGFWDDPQAPEMALVTDFASFNYQWQAYASYIKHAPGLNIFQSEAVVNELQAPYLGMDREHAIGCSYWGAIEYWGESNKWPKKGWNYAFFAHTLEPYPSAYLIKSVMVDEPIVRLAVETGNGEQVEWNDVKIGRVEEASAWDGSPGEVKRVRVYTNQSAIELFLNGRSLGVKKNDANTPQEANIVAFQVPFEPGELKAVAPDGTEHAIRTANEAVSLQVEVEANDYTADGHDLIYVRCRAVDAHGVPVRAWRGRVSFACEGAAAFLCCDNGDHMTDELFTREVNSKNAKDGFILGVFRCGKTPGEAKITITPEGLDAVQKTVCIAPATRETHAQVVDDGHADDYVKGRIDVPVKRNDAHTRGYLDRHNSILSRIRRNETHHYDLVFAGDSITHNWTREGEKRLRHVYGQSVWNEEFAGLKVLNCGFGGDRVETLHWRLANGELKGYTADFFCVLIGTNNRQDASDKIAGGIEALVKTIEAAHSESRIVLMTILPRCDIHPPKVTEDVIARVRGANPLIEAFAAKHPQVTILNLDDKFLDDKGQVKTSLFNDGIHPNAEGYRIWAEELKKLMGKKTP